MVNPRAKSRSTPLQAQHVDLIDTVSLYSLTEDLKGHGVIQQQQQLQYKPLLEALAAYRQDHALDPADLHLAPVTLDPLNEKQTRFVDALEAMGIRCNATDFRQAYLSIPGIYGQKFPGVLVPSVATQITYALGLLAGRGKGSVVVVSGVFDVYIPLSDYVGRGGKAVVAFLRRYLDPRWEQYGAFGENGGIAFLDLEPYAESLLGASLQSMQPQTRSGLRNL
jgi:hypothetical protein